MNGYPRFGWVDILRFQHYKIVEKNDFAFNPARINVGSIARLTTFEKGIISPMYICFRTQENVAPEYIDFFFESKHFYCEIQKRLEGSVRQCLSFEGLCNIPFSLPSLEMQQRIGKRLFTLGQKIKTETDLLELLNKQKQYLLRVCQNSLILKKSQSPDFHKPGLCYV